jgi:hypothetical protein
MLNSVLTLLNIRKNKILLLAEASLPESQSRPFRKIFLGEFGEKGLEGKLQEKFCNNDNGNQ